MAQLSLFDTTPPAPKVPRPPGRDKKRVEEKAAETMVESNVSAIDSPASDTTPIVVNDAPSSNVFHFEPAPIYTEEIATNSAIVEELGMTYISKEIPVTSIEAHRIEEEKTISTDIQLTEKKPDIKASIDMLVASPKVLDEISSTVSEKKKLTSKASSTQTKDTVILEEAVSEEPSLVVDTAHLTKQYYSISEVAAMFNVNASHLRYWEKEFPIQLGKIRKNGKGDRFYTPKNIEQLQVLFYLVKTKKMTLEGARDYLKQKKRGIKSTMDTSALLQQVRGFLVSLKKELDD